MIRFLLKLIEESFTRGRQSSETAKSLPLEAQNYIDNRILDAVERINDQTDRRLREIVKDKFRVWDKFGTYWTSFWILLAIAGWFGGKDYLRRGVEQSARDYLTTNIVHQAMLEVFRSNVAVFTQTELQPLNAKIKQFEDRIEVAISNFSSEQAKLLESQRSISEQQQIIDLSMRAKGGDSGAYDQLKRLGTNSVFSATAIAAETDVGFYFMHFVRPENTMAHIAGGRPIVESVEDDIWHLFQPNPSARVVSAYQLRLHKKVSALMPLAEALVSETNLFARAQIITTIGSLKGTSLHCLDLKAAFELVAAETNGLSTNRWYGCLVDGERLVEVPVEHADEIIRCANGIIANEPYALRTRCIRGWCYAKKGDRRGAIDDFAEVEKLSPDFPWLWFYRGLTQIGFNDESEGVKSLNRAFQSRTDLADYARHILASRWLTNSLIQWPKK